MKAMTFRTAASSSREPTGSRSVQVSRRWALPHYLALLALPIAFVELWTVVAWLADSPTQVTQFRQSGSLNWWAAHGCEIGMALASVPVIVHLYRDVKRQGRVLTFDVMFCLACATLWWADDALNFFQPNFVVSSNFINLTNPLGHLPFVVNPDIGRAPDAILFYFLVETFGVLGAAMLVSNFLARLKRNRDDFSRARQAFVILAIGAAIELLWEPVSLGLGLWSYELPLSLHIGSRGGNYPFAELVEGALFFALLIMLREFKNDKGESIAERGLSKETPRVGRAISLAALYAAAQLIMWVGGNLPAAASSFYAPQWHPLPSYLVNGICNVPGTNDPPTRYGPCPGSPGFRMPGRHALPGKSP
jgi:hypothetical protein